MRCTSPKKGFRSLFPNQNGNHPIKFKFDHRSCGEEIWVPCRQCLACRMSYGSEWGLRCLHEMQYHAHSSFITLSYDDDHYPNLGSLCHNDWKNFVRRHRYRLAKSGMNPNIGYFMAGEYGSKVDPSEKIMGGQLGRPHFHAIVFGHGFHDREFLSQNALGHSIYTSRELSEVWGKGFVSVGKATFESARYTAAYMLKKQRGEFAEDYYRRAIPETGELVPVQSEYSQALALTEEGKQTGIGRRWYEDNKFDLLGGYCLTNISGKMVKLPIPEYYWKLMASDPDPVVQRGYEKIAEKRLEMIDYNDPELSDERLAVKNEINEIKALKLQRDKEMRPKKRSSLLDVG